MIENSNIYDRFVLQAMVKLGDQGNRDHQWINFWLFDPATGNNQRLSEVKLNTYPQNSPIEILAPKETIVRIRVYGSIQSNLIPPPLFTYSLDFRTHIESFGDYTNNNGNGFKISGDDNYWSGVLYAQLKFYASCP